MENWRFFCDRSLGDHHVPGALRAAGWQIVSMRERYGSVTAQQLADIDWIRDATSEGEILLTGDKAIAKRPVEARAVVSAGARVFALGSSQLTGEEKAQRLLDHEREIPTRRLDARAVHRERHGSRAGEVAPVRIAATPPAPAAS